MTRYHREDDCRSPGRTDSGVGRLQQKTWDLADGGRSPRGCEFSSTKTAAAVRFSKPHGFRILEKSRRGFSRIPKKITRGMGRSLLKAVLDTNILIDLVNGHEEANNEIGRYSWLAISRINWIEVLTGARRSEDQKRVDNLLRYFEMIELNESVAHDAISLRRQHRLKPPDAIIWAAARLNDSLLVTRDSRDFPIGDPGIRVPYQIGD
jgi:predicted nucleic acid-binding protein